MYYLISHHDTILYVDEDAQHLRHAPFGIAPLNLVLELSGSQGRLVMRRGSLSEVRQVSFSQSTGEIRTTPRRADLDLHVETFGDGSVGIRAGERYVGADIRGIVFNDIAWGALPSRQGGYFRYASVPAPLFLAQP